MRCDVRALPAKWAEMTRTCVQGQELTPHTPELRIHQRILRSASRPPVQDQWQTVDAATVTLKSRALSRSPVVALWRYGNWMLSNATMVTGHHGARCVA